MMIDDEGISDVARKNGFVINPSKTHEQAITYPVTKYDFALDSYVLTSSLAIEALLTRLCQVKSNEPITKAYNKRFNETLNK